MHKIEADKRAGIDSTDIINRLLHTDLYKYQNVEDLFTMGLWINQEDHDNSFPKAKKIAEACERRACEMSAKTTDKEQQKWYQLYLKCQLFLAPYNFDDYLLFLEHKRPPEKQFYLPRRNVLRPVINDLQDLEDGRIKFYGLSMPARTGKSTTGIMYMTWQMGKYPDKSNLMSGHSDALTNGFYKEALNIIQSEEYAFKDIFQNVKVESTSAEYEAINLNTPSRFPTLTCRSIEGTTTGAVEAGNLLYTDDLVKDREESLSPERMEKKYQDYLNTLVDRKLDHAKEMSIATRWCVLDVLGRLEEKYGDDPLYRFRKIPALNDKDESNFKYGFGIGFSTDYYKDMRDKLDDNEWQAKYQQRPYIREGLIFPELEMLTYNGTLPPGAPDRVVAVIDTAYGGGDSLSMPIAYQYGTQIYIHDVVFNRGDKSITVPLVAGKIMQHGVQLLRVEQNNGGDMYGDLVQAELEKAGYHCNISSRSAPGKSGKIARIVQYAPDIKKFYFRSNRRDEYAKFFNELITLVQVGKNLHDDSGDSLAQLAAFLFDGGGYCEPITRPF